MQCLEVYRLDIRGIGRHATVFSILRIITSGVLLKMNGFAMRVLIALRHSEKNGNWDCLAHIAYFDSKCVFILKRIYDTCILNFARCIRFSRCTTIRLSGSQFEPHENMKSRFSTLLKFFKQLVGGHTLLGHQGFMHCPCR